MKERHSGRSFKEFNTYNFIFYLRILRDTK